MFRLPSVSAPAGVRVVRSFQLQGLSLVMIMLNAPAQACRLRGCLSAALCWASPIPNASWRPLVLRARWPPQVWQARSIGYEGPWRSTDLEVGSLPARRSDRFAARWLLAGLRGPRRLAPSSSEARWAGPEPHARAAFGRFTASPRSASTAGHSPRHSARHFPKLARPSWSTCLPPNLLDALAEANRERRATRANARYAPELYRTTGLPVARSPATDGRQILFLRRLSSVFPGPGEVLVNRSARVRVPSPLAARTRELAIGKTESHVVLHARTLGRCSWRSRRNVRYPAVERALPRLRSLRPRGLRLAAPRMPRFLGSGLGPPARRR